MAAVVPIGPRCPGCAGGGELNGLVCPECDGSTRLTLRKRRWRWPSLWHVADAVATPAGTLVRWSMSLPGLAGAAAVSYGGAAIVHGLTPRVPELAAALVMAGVFALALDRRLLCARATAACVNSTCTNAISARRRLRMAPSGVSAAVSLCPGRSRSHTCRT